MSRLPQLRCAAPGRRTRTRRSSRRHGWLGGLMTIGLAACADPVAESPPLARLAIAPGSLTVSGISAGGYMAGQLHVAHSQAVAGAAILAAGPYYCAEDSMRLALGRCMQGDATIPVEGLLDATRALAVAGKIDPISGLAGDRVWIFRGGGDPVIREPVVAALDGYYRSLVEPANVARIDHPAAGHTFPTLAAGGACEATAAPFVGACAFDAAGALLGHLYGALERRGDPTDGELIVFDQRPYAEEAGSRGLDAHGWLYVPRTCAGGASCRLHVVFHGCKQGASFVGEQFVRSAGYLEWAASNGIALLFPQVAPSYQPLNPNGCWDWWGYEGSNYATHAGPQIAAVWRMINDLGALPAD